MNHEITNQTPPLAGSNAWRGDPLLMQLAQDFSDPARKDLDQIGRFVLTAEAQDLARLELAEGDRIDVVAGKRVLAGQTAVAFPIAKGSVAAYYPEANMLLGLADYDRRSGTPCYKSIPVTLRRAQAASGV